MLDSQKCRALFECAELTKNLDGEFWDCGCHAGGSAAIMKSVATRKTVRMFDSFEGLPKNSSKDSPSNDEGRFAVPLHECLWILGPVHKGWVPDTFAGLEDSKISLAHIDLDMYQSTKDALTFIAPRIVSGGIMVIDDYGSNGWCGVARAVDEFDTSNFTLSVKAPEQLILQKK